MPFRSLVTTPEELAKLSAAFDVAWIVINRQAPVEPTDQSRARELLGYILIALWRDDPSSDLAELAVARYLRDTLDAKSTVAHPLGRLRADEVADGSAPKT